MKKQIFRGVPMAVLLLFLGSCDLLTTPAKGTGDTVTGKSSSRVTGVSLNMSWAGLSVGQSIVLTPKVSPDTATDKSISWTSSQPSVATVAAGVVSGIAAGTTVITVRTTDGAYSANCDVTIAGPGPKIILGLDNEAYGASLVALWNSTYPDKAGFVAVLKIGSDTAFKLVADTKASAPDVVMGLTSHAPKFAGALADIPADLVTMAQNNLDTPFFTAANNMFTSTKVLPFAYDGMAFAWNKTMLTALGEDVSQVTADNLPVNFDTWEKIFALSTKWNNASNRPSYLSKPVNIVFPFSLDEPWSGYSSLSAGGWTIFSEANGAQPGFEKAAFLQGLEFIQAAAVAKLSVEANGSLTPGSGMGWRWNPVLNDQSAPFGLVGTWMDIKGALAKGGHDMQVAPMPTYNGFRLKPLLKVKVYALNAYSTQPALAADLLRLIFTKAGMQAMIDNSAYVPSLQTLAPITPEFTNDKIKQQMLNAFRSSYPEPVTLKLPNNAAKQAMDVYYNIGLPQSLMDVWDGVKTPNQAQTAIVASASQWMLVNNKQP